MVPVADALKAGAKKAPAAIDLTPFPGVKASGIIASKQVKDVLYIGLNRRNASIFDIYRLDIPSRRLTLEIVNPGDVLGWVTDFQFNIKARGCTGCGVHGFGCDGSGGGEQGAACTPRRARLSQTPPTGS